MREDRFISPEPLPEGIERELLVILMEECAEVTQRASKALRFGVSEVQPGQPHTNAERLTDEIGDLIAVLARLTDEGGILNPVLIENAATKKEAKLEKYLQSDPRP